jgi:hypothetical protein
VTPQELAELDLAVAKAEKIPHCWNALERRVAPIGKIRGFSTMTSKNGFIWYHPTEDGAEAMRLLEKYRLSLRPHDHPNWRVYDYHTERESIGPTPAIAICRAVVALKGETNG